MSREATHLKCRSDHDPGVRAYTGAGFLCPIAGDIMTMPGLSSTAAVHQIDVDDHDEIVGLF